MNAFPRTILPPTGHLADANARLRHPAEKGAWIWHPACARGETAVLRFKCRFVLEHEARPLLHVTADQRFQLRCDGRGITFGPDRCDLEHWTVQSVELPLSPGVHELEALVWWIADPEGVAMRADPNQGGAQLVAPPMAQMTWRGGFLLYSQDLPAAVLNTGSADWQVEDLTGAVEMSRPLLAGYHDVGPSYDVDLVRWVPGAVAPAAAAVVMPPLVETIHGVRRPGWCLYPAALPEQRRAWWSGGRIRAHRQGLGEAPIHAEETAPDLATAWQALLDREEELEVPPHTQLAVLWDFEDYRCGYPQAQLQGGKGARLEWEWAESLFETEPDGLEASAVKGHRGEIIGKVFRGLGDTWRLDGREIGELPALWWRAGRYVRLRIQTAAAPLGLGRVGLITTGYPLDLTARWRSSDSGWDALMENFHRCFRNAAHETWTDTPYYEQMCYVGDNIMHALANYAWYADDRISRRSLELFDWSRRPSGLVAERYPSAWRQESVTYSMLWPMMIRDFVMWRDAPDFIARLLPGMRGVLAEIESLTNARGLVKTTPGWPFIDWVPEWSEGCGPGVREGDSSIVNLQWVLCLQAAAEVEDAHGDPALAERNRRLAQLCLEAVVERYWDEERGILLDTRDSAAASEHAQFFALLTGLLDAEKTRRCLEALRQDASLLPATISAVFYLLDVLYQNGEEEEFHRRLEFWQGLPAQGILCTPEMPEPARSDAHAWGAHPAWHSLASMAGIRPAAPGFRKVRIAPCPGAMRFIQCSVVHPRGLVEAEMEFGEDGGVTANITLPVETTGEFVWRGKRRELAAGTTKFRLSI